MSRDRRLVGSCPRQYYLRLHDLIKKLHPDSTISAFITDKHPYRCDMLVTDKSFYRLANDTALGMRVFGKKLLDIAPDLSINMSKHRVACFFRTGHCLNVTCGVPDQTVDHINQTPHMHARTFLRMCQGYDEDLFLESTDRVDRAAAVFCTDWASQLLRCRTDIEHPSSTYWLSHVHLMRKNCLDPVNDAAITIFATIQEHSPKLFGVHPLEAPFCPGEDLNTTIVAQRFNLFAMNHVTQARCLARNPSLVKLAQFDQPDAPVCMVDKTHWDDASFVAEADPRSIQK
jgi:hypothetical protein